MFFLLVPSSLTLSPRYAVPGQTPTQSVPNTTGFSQLPSDMHHDVILTSATTFYFHIIPHALSRVLSTFTAIESMQIK